MKTAIATKGTNRTSWYQRSIARLLFVWHDLQRLVMAEFRPRAKPVLIPIRIEQPDLLRHSKRRSWRD